MRRHRLLVLLMLSALCGCARIGPVDEMVPYRPAMQVAAQGQLDGLGRMPRYDIRLRVDPAAEQQVTGWERVQVVHRGQDVLGDLFFRLYPNLPQYSGSMFVGGAAVNGQTVPFTYEAQSTAVRIVLPEPLPPEGKAAVEFSFGLRVPRREEGYVLCGESQGILSLPLFYPVLAVRDERTGLPLWRLDIAPPTHGDVAYVQMGLYQVTATVPSGIVVAATGTVVSTTVSSVGEGWVDLHIVGGPRREFMLILSPQFQTASTDACGARVTSYFLPQDQATGQAALQYAAAALRVYCQHYGPYPFRDMAVVSAPIRYYGMEYSGLNLIGLDLYRQQRKGLEFLIVHEVAHQWWYNMVGNDPLTYPWLDEGLAEYSTYTYQKERYGEDIAEALVERRWRSPYKYAVEQGLDAVVNQPSSAFSVANYETMIYAKAALFFDAVRREVGEETYYRLLREYLHRYRWGEATPADFLAVAEEISGHDLGAIYQRWILTALEP